MDATATHDMAPEIARSDAETRLRAALLDIQAQAHLLVSMAEKRGQNTLSTGLALLASIAEDALEDGR